MTKKILDSAAEHNNTPCDEVEDETIMEADGNLEEKSASSLSTDAVKVLNNLYL